jgi:chaperone required for assembly of F1-ATPase
MTTLTGSALLALAVARGLLSAEAAWRPTHVGEDFQAERWGADAEAMARREAGWRELEAAAIVVAPHARGVRRLLLRWHTSRQSCSVHGVS